MIVQNKSYQRSVFLSSTNAVTGRMFETSNKVVEFFKLSEANKNLSEENTRLLNQLTEMEARLSAISDSTQIASWENIRISPENEYSYISAKVIRITTGHLQNYITLNKGSDEGIQPDMGVIADNGVVGIVESVSKNFSKVMPLLHPRSTIISKFKKTNYYGPLVWDGKDERYGSLNDIARHVKFSLGDTLLTGGFKTFPEGLMVGTVNNYNITQSDAYYNIQVKFAVDFQNLTHVKVIDYKHYKEQNELENSHLTESSKN